MTIFGAVSLRAAAAGVEPDLDGARIDEARSTEDQLDIGRLPRALLPVVAETLDHLLLARDDLRQVDVDIVDVDAVVGAAPRQVRDTRAGDHRLGGRAADVDASAADVLALDQRDLPARLGERECQWLAGLAATDDHGVETFGGHCITSLVGCLASLDMTTRTSNPAHASTRVRAAARRRADRSRNAMAPWRSRPWRRCSRRPSACGCRPA